MDTRVRGWARAYASVLSETADEITGQLKGEEGGDFLRSGSGFW